jgi:hypothetical protein
MILCAAFFHSAAALPRCVQSGVLFCMDTAQHQHFSMSVFQLLPLSAFGLAISAFPRAAFLGP